MIWLYFPLTLQMMRYNPHKELFFMFIMINFCLVYPTVSSFCLTEATSIFFFFLRYPYDCYSLNNVGCELNFETILQTPNSNLYSSCPPSFRKSYVSSFHLAPGASITADLHNTEMSLLSCIYLMPSTTLCSSGSSYFCIMHEGGIAGVWKDVIMFFLERSKHQS